jgi:hypothetical protein
MKTDALVLPEYCMLVYNQEQKFLSHDPCYLFGHDRHERIQFFMLQFDFNLGSDNRAYSAYFLLFKRKNFIVKTTAAELTWVVLFS